jgi:hypothetical protein
MARRFFLTALTGLVTASQLLLLSHAYAQSGSFTTADTTRINIGTFSGAAQANSASINPQISRNGRFVVFESTATNLVNYLSVTPGRRHIYLVDRQSGSLELVSVNRDGGEVVGDSYSPSVSADGRYIAFVSNAGSDQFITVDLCGNDAHVNIFYPGTHVWVRDRLANKTFLASQVTMPVQVQDGICDGSGAKVRKICKFLDCDTNNPNQYTLAPSMITFDKRVSAGIRPYRNPDLVTYKSATSLNPKISGDGQFVAFDSDADNLAGFVASFGFMPVIADQSTSCTSPPCDYDNNAFNPTTGGVIRTIMGFPAISRFIDGNGVRDIFVRDGSDFSTKMVNLGCLYHATGACAVQGQLDSTKPQISDDGKYVSFETRWNFLDLDFNNKTDVFLVERGKLNDEVANLDRVSNNTSRLLAANDSSNNSSMSADGRYIAFDSAANNIVLGDSNNKRDVFVYDSKFFVTIRCGTASAPQGDGDSSNPSIDGSGNFISFESTSSNWGASGGVKNIFVGRLVRDSIGRLASCEVELATPGQNSTGGNAASSLSTMGTVPRTSATPNAPRTQIPAISYQSLATNLHGGSADSNGLSDIFQAPTCSQVDLVTDTDGDGTIDCFDQCRLDALKVTDKDSDADGYPDCEDGCDSDAQKSGPGICGCGALDTDSDEDGTLDCEDSCPADADKVEAGTCGCGVADVDLNSNGVIDCVESSAPTSPTPAGTNAPPTPTSAVPPTPSVDLPSLSPGTVRIQKVSTRSIRINLSAEINLGSSFAGYEVALERVNNRTIGERVVFTVNNSVGARNLGPGRYRARFRMINVSGQRTQWSKYSNSFRVR